MAVPSALAEYAWILQPVSIRKRLLSHRELVERFGLNPPAVLRVGQVAEADRAKFFAAVRMALSSDSEQRLRDFRGREIVIARGEGGVGVKAPPETQESSQQVILEDLLIFSPIPEERLASLDRILSRLGPTASDWATLRVAMTERELSDQEAVALTEEMTNGVAARHERAISSIRANCATLDLIVPSAMAYYERLCGPNPGGASPEDYLTGAVPRLRKELLRRHLVQGLDICLLGFLRDDLSPAGWTNHLGDDELWTALTECDFWHDPFSLLGALDLSLWRQHDGRFADTAEKAIAALARDEFARPDNMDGYALQALFAELVLNRLCTLEGAVSRPPYWRRMSAWMQAGLLLRWTHGIGIDFAQIKDWIQNQLSAAGGFVKLLDLRREPMFRAGETSGRALRNELIGRLMQIRKRHEAAGRVHPRFHVIDDAAGRLAEHVGLLVGGSPGPLEGHLRAGDFGPRRMDQTTIAEIEDALSADPSGWVWSAIAGLSQHFDLRVQGLILGRAREVAKTVSLEGEQRGEVLARLTDGALAAASLRDTGLAKAIWSRVLSSWQPYKSDEEVARVLRLLLIASTAIEDEGPWSEWLEEELTQLAGQLPPAQAPYLTLQLRELRKVLPWAQSVTSKAESIASAAA